MTQPDRRHLRRAHVGNALGLETVAHQADDRALGLRVDQERTPRVAVHVDAGVLGEQRHPALQELLGNLHAELRLATA